MNAVASSLQRLTGRNAYATFGRLAACNCQVSSREEGPFRGGVFLADPLARKPRIHRTSNLAQQIRCGKSTGRNAYATSARLAACNCQVSSREEGPFRGGVFLADPVAMKPRIHRTSNLAQQIRCGKSTDRNAYATSVRIAACKGQVSSREEGPFRGGVFLADPVAMKPRIHRNSNLAQQIRCGKSTGRNAYATSARLAACNCQVSSREEGPFRGGVFLADPVAMKPRIHRTSNLAQQIRCGKSTDRNACAT